MRIQLLTNSSHTVLRIQGEFSLCFQNIAVACILYQEHCFIHFIFVRNVSFPEPWKIQNFEYMILLALAMATKGANTGSKLAMWPLSQEFRIETL